MSTKLSNEIYVGIDVSKNHLDIAVRSTGRRWQVENTEEGIGSLVAELIEIRPDLIVLEATGGLEVAVTSAMAAAG